MTVHPPADAAQTWRDLADDLTPEHVRYLESWESHPEWPLLADGSTKTPEDHQRALLFSARNAEDWK